MYSRHMRTYESYSSGHGPREARTCTCTLKLQVSTFSCLPLFDISYIVQFHNMQECHMHCIQIALVPRVLQVYKFKRYGMVQNARLGVLGMMVQKTNGPLAWMTKDMPPCGVLPPSFERNRHMCISTSISKFNTYQMM